MDKRDRAALARGGPDRKLDSQRRIETVKAF
jgi:hypothetical protein